jgi:hypothetical protein
VDARVPTTQLFRSSCALAHVRATTIRFPNDLWEQLEREAEKQGISVAQYVRDAALYRVAFSAGAAGGGEREERRFPRAPRTKR